MSRLVLQDGAGAGASAKVRTIILLIYMPKLLQLTFEFSNKMLPKFACCTWPGRQQGRGGEEVEACAGELNEMRKTRQRG